MIPVGDYVRDALAVMFLLMPLGMAWDLQHQATSHDYVIPVTLLSILSLALPYLKAASVLPGTLSIAQIRLIRLLANVPYVIVVLFTLVLGYVDASARDGAGRGVGVGVVFGLVGVLLAAQGRASEQREGPGDGDVWRVVARVIAGLGVLLGVLSAVLFLIEAGGEVRWSTIAVLVVKVTLFVGVPLIAVRGVVRRDRVWRDVTVVLGGVGLLAALWAQGAEATMGEAWSIRLGGPQFLFWPALGAAAAAAGVSASMPRLRGAERWVRLPGRLFQVVALVAVLALLAFGFRLVDNVASRGPFITGLVLSLIILVMATLGRNALVNDARAGRPVALGAAAVLILVSFIEISVLGFSQSAIISADIAMTICVWLVVAMVVIVALTAPPSVQEELTPVDDGPEVAFGRSAYSPHVDDESIWAADSDDA